MVCTAHRPSSICRYPLHTRHNCRHFPRIQGCTRSCHHSYHHTLTGCLTMERDNLHHNLNRKHNSHSQYLAVPAQHARSHLSCRCQRPSTLPPVLRHDDRRRHHQSSAIGKHGDTNRRAPQQRRGVRCCFVPVDVRPLPSPKHANTASALVLTRGCWQYLDSRVILEGAALHLLARVEPTAPLNV